MDIPGERDRATGLRPQAFCVVVDDDDVLTYGLLLGGSGRRIVITSLVTADFLTLIGQAGGIAFSIRSSKRFCLILVGRKHINTIL